MSVSDYRLASPPDGDRARELWIQHAAGFILMEDVRKNAIEKLSPGLSEREFEAAKQGVDMALLGLMAVIDGVTGELKNESECVDLTMLVRYSSHNASGEIEDSYELNLRDGDGVCMGVHGWFESDFGDNPVATPRVK